MRPLLSDDSIVLGHVSGLCERGMVPVAMRLLTLSLSLPPLNGITANMRYASKYITMHLCDQACENQPCECPIFCSCSVIT